MKSSRESTKMILLAHGLVTVACLISTTPIPAVAQETATATNESGVEITTGSHRIDFEVGYFTSRQRTFRELYGNSTDFAFGYQRPLASHLAVCLRAECFRLTEYGPDREYANMSLAPMVLFTPQPRALVQPTFGVGIGLSLRKVIMIIPGRVAEYPYPPSKATQKELSVFGVVMAGVDLNLPGRFVPGVRAYFDYLPFGDPTVGDFGDTGGLHLMGRVGFRL